jgi:hypothetical protein
MPETARLLERVGIIRRAESCRRRVRPNQWADPPGALGPWGYEAET